MDVPEAVLLERREGWLYILYGKELLNHPLNISVPTFWIPLTSGPQSTCTSSTLATHSGELRLLPLFQSYLCLIHTNLATVLTQTCSGGVSSNLQTIRCHPSPLQLKTISMTFSSILGPVCSWRPISFWMAWSLSFHTVLNQDFWDNQYLRPLLMLFGME